MINLAFLNLVIGFSALVGLSKNGLIPIGLGIFQRDGRSSVTRRTGPAEFRSPAPPRKDGFEFPRHQWPRPEIKRQRPTR